jgi:type I restriction enzyme, S subunit
MSDQSKWEEVPLSKVLDFREGPGILAYDFQPEGIPLIRLAGLKRGVDLLDGCNYLDEQMVLNRWNHFRLELGDVLLSTSASLGEVALVGESGVGAVPYTGIIRFRPKNHRILPDFIQFALTAPTFKQQIESMGVGSVMRHFGPSHLAKMTVNLPPANVQEAIAAVLRALDDKIVVNDRIARACHDLAQTQSLYAHEGARLASLKTIASITMGSSPPGDTYNEMGVGIPFYQGTRDFGERFPARRVWCAAPVRLAQGGSTLVSVRAPVGRVNMAREECCIGRGLASFESRFGTPSTLFHELAAASSIWTPYESEGTVFGAVNKAQIENLSIPCLDKALALRLEGILRPLDQRVASAFSETETLGELRETLLPGLMSGRIRVQDAERVVEDAS